MRNWPGDRPILDAPAGNEERNALTHTISQLQHAFSDRVGSEADDAELRQLLALIRVSSYEFGDDGSTEHAALLLLRRSIVEDTNRAGDAWNALCRAAMRDTKGQSGMNRRAAQEVLRRETIALQAPRSYRTDIAQLVADTETTLGMLQSLSDIPLRVGRAKIVREAPAELNRLAEQGSCVVVGDPGAGKSATLFELTDRLRASGADVVALAADRLDSGSLGLLRTELNLARGVVEVLAGWPTARGYLVIDALDAARGDKTQQALLDLIEGTRRHAGHWTIVVSIRRFDLRYNPRLRDLFPAQTTPPPEYVDPEFPRVNHFSVALLSGGELDQLERLAPDIHAFLATAPADLRDLVRVPFNLRLLAELVDARVTPETLHPIRTHLELLDTYWTHRVLTPIDRGDDREMILRAACEAMVSSRSMLVNRADLHGGAVLAELLSAQLLIENTLPSGILDRSMLGFAHHVLFDYATARLLLRRATADLVHMLTAGPDLPILIRPSLDLHLRWLWESDPSHRGFWELTFAMVREEGMRDIAVVVAANVAAEMTRVIDDLASVINAITSTDADDQQVGERVLRHVLFSAQVLNVPFGGDAAGPWTSLLAHLSDA